MLTLERCINARSILSEDSEQGRVFVAPVISGLNDEENFTNIKSVTVDGADFTV